MTDPRIFVGVYDLKTSPFTFDFMTFLAMCQAYRLDRGCDGLHVIIVPGQGTGFEGADFKKYHANQFPIEHAQWRVMNVFMPALSLVPELHGVTICMSRDHGREILKDYRGPIFPVDYDIENPPELYWNDFEASMLANLGFEFPGFRAPPEALNFIDQWIERTAGGRKVVTMTLREGLHDPVKNSNIEAWVEFAKSLDQTEYYPVFIPDMVRSFDGSRPDLGGVPIFTDPVSNIMIRTALYERCYIAMFTTCGPIQTSYFNGAVRYLIFKISPPNYAEKFPWDVLTGIDPANNDFRVATPYQKRFDEDESFELLTREFNAMVSRIEANPEDAFRRHRLRRTDVGPQLVARVSDYLALRPNNFQAVQFCHRFLDRYPEQIDDVMGILAYADIAIRHDHTDTLKRSLEIYESWLENRTEESTEHALAAWARIKIGVRLGNWDQLIQFVRAAPLIDERFNKFHALQTELLSIAVAFSQRGHVDEAFHIAKMVDDVYRSPSSSTMVAMILESRGRVEEAREIFLNLLERGVESPVVYESLSRIYRNSGDMQQSLEYLHRSVAARTGV